MGMLSFASQYLFPDAQEQSPVESAIERIINAQTAPLDPARLSVLDTQDMEAAQND